MTKRDHLEFLCDVGELGAVLAGSSDIETFLQRLVRLVADHLQAHVCSIYLYEDASRELVLRATVGLHLDSAKQIRLKEGEGLVGTTLQKRQPILDNRASRNPRYKYFPGIGEEPYDAFLAVPIVRDVQRIGVLAVQREMRNPFREDDVTAMRAVACQLAGCIENARVLMGLASPQQPERAPQRATMLFIRARVASPGYGMGPVRCFRGSAPSLSESVSQLRPDLTLSDLRHAVDRTASQIKELQQRVADRLPEAVAMIFSAHLLMLKDPGFVEAMVRQIEGGKSVGQAILDVAQYYVEIFAGSGHSHMREKVQDVEDLVLRLIDNLRQDVPLACGVGSHAVIVAGSLYPSELVTLSLEDPSGFVLVGGGATTHVSILARSLEVPLLMADDSRLMTLDDGTRMLLDGHTGNIYVEPSAEVIREFETRRDVIASRHSSPQAETATQTQDGTHVQLMANINLLREVAVAREVNAEGIGLYRTEFPFLIRSGFPDEEEQYLIYRQLLEGMPGKPVTVRTLDIGGDKTLAYYPQQEQSNPELGLRSIRFSLRHRDLFEQQVRAILRAGADAQDLRLMFPMISSLDEFREARAVVEHCMMELQREATRCCSHLQIGMMVELPSVLETAEEYCREADFFSIGSNDFIQYMLAADRGNESVAAYYCAHHPAVLRGIARFVHTAQAHQRPVSVCGEVAHQKDYIPFLLGVGVRILSVDPHCIVDLQQFIQSLTISAVEHEAEILLREGSITAVAQRLREFGRLSDPDSAAWS